MIHIQGDGGHAKVVREALESSGSDVGLPYFWGPRLAFIAVGDNKDRQKESQKWKFRGCRFVKIIHKKASVAKDVVLGEGTLICAGAVIDTAVTIGRHVIVNAGAVVTHDCVIEDYAHIAPGVHLCGGVHVGEGALVGVGSCAVPGAKIPAWSLVKAGSVVT